MPLPPLPPRARRSLPALRRWSPRPWTRWQAIHVMIGRRSSHKTQGAHSCRTSLGKVHSRPPSSTWTLTIARRRLRGALRACARPVPRAHTPMRLRCLARAAGCNMGHGSPPPPRRLLALPPLLLPSRSNGESGALQSRSCPPGFMLNFRTHGLPHRCPPERGWVPFPVPPTSLPSRSMCMHALRADTMTRRPDNLYTHERSKL